MEKGRTNGDRSASGRSLLLYRDRSVEIVYGNRSIERPGAWPVASGSPALLHAPSKRFLTHELEVGLLLAEAIEFLPLEILFRRAWLVLARAETVPMCDARAERSLAAADEVLIVVLDLENLSDFDVRRGGFYGSGNGGGVRIGDGVSRRGGAGREH